MREEDIRPLRDPFTEAELANWEPALRDRLGASTANTDDLLAALYDDLDPKVFGIGWWGGRSIQRRILTGDQLVLCVRDVSSNVLEARLHQLEAVDRWERFAERLTPEGPGPDPRVLVPPVVAPIDEMPRLLAELNTIGFFRAVGSALDCLAGAMIGVGGYPARILKADLGGLRQRLATLGQRGALHPWQQALAHNFEHIAATSGPHGWLEWTLDMRNMLVHRGRRVSPVIIAPAAPGLIVPAGRNVRADLLLPIDPGRQEMEVLREGASPFEGQLREHSAETVAGVYGSARTCIEGVAPLLSDLWMRRRARPNEIEQPLDEQWPDLTPSPATGFQGYNPGAVNVPVGGAMLVNPREGLRLRAAAVMDPDRERWKTFP